MPPNADVATESKIMFVREKFSELIETYCKDGKGDYLSNLTKQQKLRLKRLKDKAKNKAIANFITDKSSKMCTDTPENYIDSMQPHIAGVDDIGNLLNAHMNFWCNIIHANYRVRWSFQATNNAIPPEYGLRKYHKVFNDVIKDHQQDRFAVA